MEQLYKKIRRISRSVSPENFTGEKGCGGAAEEGTGKSFARDLGIVWKISPSAVIKSGENFTLADIHGEGIIRHIWITDSSPANRLLVLRMYWDGSSAPSVEVPLGDFFAAAEYQNYSPVVSETVCVNPKRGFNCYWEMPFYREARFTLENISDGDITVYYQIDYTLESLPENCMYFHAQFRRSNPLPYKQVHTLLDGISGAGAYIGTYMFWGVNNNGWWGEGEIKFYLDGDKDFPTICGTGTEDYFCGSWNFDTGGRYQEFCTPYCGMPKVIRPDGLYSTNQRFSLYRWHIKDPIYFSEDIRITIQALGWRSGGRYLPLQDDISSVAYFYLDRCSDISGTLPDRDGLELI